MPAAGAMLEIRQTDGQGRHCPQDDGDDADLRDEDMDRRGTAMPLFPKEAGSAPPPPHIHYRISAAGCRTLMTQHCLDTRPRERPRRTATGLLDRTPAIYLEPA